MIQGGHRAGLNSSIGLRHPMWADVESRGQTLKAQTWLLCLFPLVLQPLRSDCQIAHSPGDANGFRPVPSVVKNLTTTTADQVAAGPKAKGRVELIDTSDQSESCFLMKVLIGLGAFTSFLSADMACQAKVLQHRLIARLDGL